MWHGGSDSQADELARDNQRIVEFLPMGLADAEEFMIKISLATGWAQ